jgi:hypothetical protein
MSKYKYSSWSSRLVSEHASRRDSWSENPRYDFFKLASNSNLDDVLAHFSTECEKVFDDKQEVTNQEEWFLMVDVLGCVNKIRVAIENQDSDSLFSAAFRLGMLDIELDRPKYKEEMFLLTQWLPLLKEKHDREHSLKLRNIAKESAREWVQGLAKLLWETDKNEEIRIGEMCEKVWNFYSQDEYSKNEFQEAFGKPLNEWFPDKPHGLKSWIRAVAPAYASKQGPPRKK